MTSGLRRSSRKRVNRNDMETPMNPINRRGIGKPSSLATPMITPKFDISTSICRSVMRLAKPNETLVSLSGSPVYADATAASQRKRRKENNQVCPIPIGRGKKIMIPVEEFDAEGNQPDLDEDAKKKLMAVRSNLDSLLGLNKGK